MSLKTVQHSVFEWVAGSDPIPDDAAAQLVNGGALEPSTRVGVYAEMYWLRMRDMLREDCARVRQVVGDDAFDVLVANYIKAHPSTHHSLGQLSHAFADWLAAQDASPPWLASVAALERARTRAFVAQNSAVAEPSALAVVNEETFSQVRLVATPALHVVSLAFDVLPWFAAADASSVVPQARVTPVMVWRRDFEVFHVEVGAAEAAAAHALVGAGPAGAALEVLCEPFAEPSDAFTAIASWVAEGMVASVVARSPEGQLP